MALENNRVYNKEGSPTTSADRLRHNEQRLKQAQAIAHFGSWELDFSNGISIWSDEACRIYGLEPTDNIQTYNSWLSFIHPEDIEYILEVIRAANETNSTTEVEFRIQRRDGSIRHLFSQTQYEFDTRGRKTGMYGVAHDITDAKMADLERMKIIADLVQRNTDLEQFSYIVSHNLRASVANIMGLSELLQIRDFEKEEHKKILSHISTSTFQLDSVIKDLNTILQIKHQFRENKELVCFSEIVNDIKSDMSILIKSEQLQIITDFSQIDEIVTLKSYMYSIFTNIISNSIKYHRPGVPPVLEISSRKIDDTIELIFRDNSMGIDLARNGDKIFGLYKRFHFHTEGKGMGLYMVKTQLQSLGGSISVNSQVDNGTEFRILLENK